MSVKAVVVGYGSIGARHCRVLEELGCTVACVSRREIKSVQRYSSLDAALVGHRPDYVVVANRTDEHYDTLLQLVQKGFQGKVLMEKPLFDRAISMPGGHAFDGVYVGYDMRFLPVLQRVRELIDGERVLTAVAYVGQYLPDWRPGTDYRMSYSASKIQGGGVLRDLSHELDYLNWLFGGWTAVVAHGGKVSGLEIDSDDAWQLLLKMGNCPMVSLQMSYLDRSLQRFLLLNTIRHTLQADLAEGRLWVNGNEEKLDGMAESAYHREHQAVLAGDHSYICTLAQGEDTLALIQAVEESAAQGRWICK